ncbi:MAG: riboflavin synthase [Candidatus Margulisiibacteriota bacterium]|jgi:riboflavin synthase
MFTGIIQEKGKIKNIKKSSGKTSFIIEAKKIIKNFKIGSSVALNGTCLTIINLDKKTFEVEAIPETLKLTNLGELQKGDLVNLEPSLRLKDELSGHIVLGHVDSMGEVINIKSEGDSILMTIKFPKSLSKYIAHKGSITLDGISLTIASLFNQNFVVALIPHTLEVTILKNKKIGDKVNLEVDVVARYLERMIKSKDSSDVTLLNLKKKRFV